MNSDFYLQNNLHLVPRDQMRIERLAVAPDPDRARVKIEVEVTPFKEQPNLEISIRDQNGILIGGASVIAPMHFKMEFTVYLRGASHPAGNYCVQVQLYYDDPHAPQDSREIALHI
jgi:hypothetical protein